MTPATKDTRRVEWENLNFAGTIDWTVDLQSFGQEDMDVPTEPPPAGTEGCIVGESFDYNADRLCAFACNYGFCPENTCLCTLTGPVKPLPQVVSNQEFISWDEFNVDFNRLCKITCKYGYCPEDTCGLPVVDEWDDGSVDPEDQPTGGLWDKEKNYNENRMQCQIFKSEKYQDASANQCYTPCLKAIEAAREEGLTTNWGCIGFWPLDEPIPWTKYPGSPDPDMVYAVGRCSCDNALMNLHGGHDHRHLAHNCSGTFAPL